MFDYIGKTLLKSVEFIQFPFKCLYAKFFPALFVKGIMDSAKFSYIFLDIRFFSALNDEFIDKSRDFRGDKESFFDHDRQKDVCFRLKNLIRAKLREGLCFNSEQEVFRYIGAHSYERRVEAQFFIEEYALKLLPPIQMVENNRDKRANERGACGNDGNGDITGEYDELSFLKGVVSERSITMFRLLRTIDLVKGN